MVKILKKFAAFCLAAFLLTALPTPAAQGEAAYLLDQDDVISVIVAKHETFGISDVRLPASGVFRMPVVGDVNAKGRTLQQLDDEITRRLKARLNNPEVTVLLKAARPRLVFVNGAAVAKPGALPLMPGWRVGDALAASGGLSVRPEQADATLDRAGQPLKALSLEKLLASGLHADNLLLEPGDTLRFVPRFFGATVTGMVAKSGAVELATGAGLREAIAQAGGLLADRAAASRIAIQRGAKTLTVNLYDIEKSPEKNPKIEPGDVIQVPEAKEQVTVLGAVAKQGAVRIPDGRVLTLTDAIAQAGNTLPGAALSKATLKTATGKVSAIDLRALLAAGQNLANPRGNPTLSDGDTILIPFAQTRISVTGAVARPGSFDVEDGRTVRVADAVALAGNTTERAALTRAVLSHESGKSEAIDLHALLSLGLREKGNPVMQDGDTLIVPAARGISILGAVARPDLYFLEEGAAPRLRDVLTRAGSLKPGVRPDAVRISVLRSAGDKQQLLPVDAVALLEANNPLQNLLLKDGDSINVSEIARAMVTIQGEVARRDAYELIPGEGLAQLIARAGGETSLAALRNVEVRRDGKTIIVDTLAAVRGGAVQGQKFELRGGDAIVVPRNPALVAVWPAVKSPGRYPVPEDKPLTVVDALQAAGGPLNSKLEFVTILREVPGGAPIQIPINLKTLKNGVATANQVLQPGDVLFVPERKLQDNTLGGISLLLGAARLFLP